LTKPIQIRLEWVGSEVVLPQARGEQMDVKGGMGVDALEYIHQVGVCQKVGEIANSRESEVSPIRDLAF